MDEKFYVLVAGVNGAGKSTFYKSNFAFNELFSINDNQIFENMVYINPDDILRSFGDWRNENDMLRAGIAAVRQIKDCFKNGRSFCQETTLCGSSIQKNIKFAKNSGYKVYLVYLGLDSVQLAKARVRKRVEHGGHGIPDNDIERRYVQSFLTLNKVYAFCDGIAYFDNSTDLMLLATCNQQKLELIVSKNELPFWFKEHLQAIDFDYKQNVKLLNVKSTPNHDDIR